MDALPQRPGPTAAPEPAPRDATSGSTAGAGDWRAGLSPEVRTLAEIALARALDAVVADGSPMCPFAVLEGDDGRLLARFDGAPYAAVDGARAHARESDAHRAAVAWDGWLTVGGVRQDAVVVQASDRGHPGVVVAHRYRETLDGTVVVGRPVLVGPGDPVL